MFSCSYSISAQDAGNAYNHVHHARLVELLETARNRYFESLGLPDYAGFLNKGLLLVLTELKVQYLREVRPGDITITCEEAALNEKRFILKQRILNERMKIAVTAEVEQAVVSVQRGRAVELPKFLVEALSVLPRSNVS